MVQRLSQNANEPLRQRKRQPNSGRDACSYSSLSSGKLSSRLKPSICQVNGKFTYRHFRPVSSCVRTIGCNARFSLAPSFRRVERPSRSEEHTSELQSLMRISYAVFCLKKKKNDITYEHQTY